MRIGAVYPQIDLGGDPAAVRLIGDGLESLGYDHILAYDHVLGASHAGRQPPLTGPYTENDPFHDPFVMFSYIAGRTERLEFATGVLILPQRQTALVAKQAADLSLLSGGRLRLGVGVGWNPVEYHALGEDFATRGRRLDEQVPLLRRLWSEPLVDFHGRFDQVDRAALVPRPAAPIPIWIGGLSEPAFRRAARLGDGFIFGGSPDTVEAQWSSTKERLVEHGRTLDDFGAEYVIISQQGPEEIRARVGRWEQAGGTHVSIVSMRHGFTTAAAHLDYFGRVAEALGLPR